MNAADEHGIIHQDWCKEPVDVCRSQCQQLPSPENASNSNSAAVTTNNCNGDCEIIAPMPAIVPNVAQASPVSIAPSTGGGGGGGDGGGFSIGVVGVDNDGNDGDDDDALQYQQRCVY